MPHARSILRLPLWIAILCLLLPTLAWAEPIAWTGAAGSGSWHTPGNWNLNRVPTEADDVTIALDGTYTVNIDSAGYARSLVLGGSTGTQTLAVNTNVLVLRINGAILPRGVLQLTNPCTLYVQTADGNTFGTLVNTGTIRAGADGSPGGRRILACHLDNQGAAVAYNAELTMSVNNSDVINSGTIQAIGGDFSCFYDGEFRNRMNVTNTGTIAISPGRTFRTLGTLTLQGGTFGGPGGNLHLRGATVNLGSGDFHTADWASLDVGGSTFNGPGQVINDAPGGLSAVTCTFNSAFHNISTVESYQCQFATFANPVGGVLRVRSNINLSSRISSSFTNEGTIVLVDHNLEVRTDNTETAPTGTITNAPTGVIQSGAAGFAGGRHILSANVVNQGTMTAFNAALHMGNGNTTINVTNSGTINATGGDFSSNYDGEFRNTMNVTNTGTIAISPGRTFRTLGTLTLQGGTFGGPGANLHLGNATVNLGSGDFHTADWASIYDNGAIFNGPGTFVNDHPAGFTALANTGAAPWFNTFVRNVTTFTSHAAQFTNGYVNEPGSTLSIRYSVNVTPHIVTRFYSGFINDGVIEVVDPRAGILILNAAEPYVFGTLINGPTGQIHIRKLETPAAGLRHLSCNIANHGRITVHDVDLQVGEGNQYTLIENTGTFELLGGDLVFQDAPLNKGWIRNFGTFDLGVDHTVNKGPDYYTNYPPLLFENKPGAILSGSGTIFGGEGGPTAFNMIEAGGIIRPGGENAVGTLTLLGNVTVPGSASEIGLIVEVDVGGPGPQANDQLGATLVLPPQGGRYLSVNILGQNLPPAGTPFTVGAFPYIASNLPVTDGTVCVGCYSGDSPGGACSGSLTVVGAGCPGPTITQQPWSLAPCPGDTVSLSVVATGAGPLTYQWQKIDLGVATLTDGPTGNGSTLSGVNSPTLTITNIAAADLGSYAVMVSDANGSRISSLATLIGGCVINITAATQQAFLDSLVAPNATIVMQNVPDRPTLTLSALTNLGGTMQLTGNAGLTTLTANLLATVGGRVDIRNNPLLTDVTLPALTTVTGDVDVSGNPAATGIDFPMLGGVGGSVTVTENPNAAAVNFPTLGGIGGSVAITENPNAAAVNFPLLGGVGGSVTVTENPNAATINFPILGGVGGSVTVAENPNTTSVNLLSLATVVGSVSIRDNLALAAISMPLLTDVDGGVEVSGNTAATTIDFGSLGSVNGNVTVTATQVHRRSISVP